MLQYIMRYINGWLLIRITGYSPERFLNLCSYHHIYIWKLKHTQNAYEMYITISGFKKLKPIIRKTRTNVLIKRRFGLPFFFHKYRKRKLFFIGAAASMILVYLMSLFIWNIHIEGNITRSDESIIEYLRTQNIVHGMKKNRVNCSRIVKDIRKKYDDIIWVSASIEGTRLMIQIKENSDTFPIDNRLTTEPSDIVSDKSGEIVSMITRNGTPTVRIGDTVKEGDMLVSGRIEVLNDSKEVIGYQYYTSDADIFAKTTREYYSEIPLTYEKKEYTKRKKIILDFKLGKNTFRLGKEKNNYDKAETSSVEHQLRIGENFYLPCSYRLITAKEYRSKSVPYSKEELQKILTQAFDEYCSSLKKENTELLSHTVKILIDDKKAVSVGELTLIEKIGNNVKTEIVELPTTDNNGKIENEIH